MNNQRKVRLEILRNALPTIVERYIENPLFSNVEINQPNGDDSKVRHQLATSLEYDRKK